MPFPNPLASLKALPKNQRIAVGVGGAGALGAGLYTLHKRRASGATAKPAASTAVGSALQPAPDLSQYGQVAVLVPMDYQSGANFGGSGGLVQPPAASPVVPTPVLPRPTKPPTAPAPTPTYAQLQARLSSGTSTLADRQAFYAMDQATPANQAIADANLARVRAGSLALQKALAS